MDGNKAKIIGKYCTKEVNGGITRLKKQLANQTGQVVKCNDVPQQARKEIQALLMAKKKKTEKK